MGGASVLIQVHSPLPGCLAEQQATVCVCVFSFLACLGCLVVRRVSSNSSARCLEQQHMELHMHLAHTKKHTQAERTPQQRSEFTNSPSSRAEMHAPCEAPPSNKIAHGRNIQTCHSLSRTNGTMRTLLKSCVQIVDTDNWEYHRGGFFQKRRTFKFKARFLVQGGTPRRDLQRKTQKGQSQMIHNDFKHCVLQKLQHQFLRRASI